MGRLVEDEDVAFRDEEDINDVVSDDRDAEFDGELGVCREIVPVEDDTAAFVEEMSPGLCA